MLYTTEAQTTTTVDSHRRCSRHTFIQRVSSFDGDHLQAFHSEQYSLLVGGHQTTIAGQIPPEVDRQEVEHVDVSIEAGAFRVQGQRRSSLSDEHGLVEALSEGKAAVLKWT